MFVKTVTYCVVRSPGILGLREYMHLWYRHVASHSALLASALATVNERGEMGGRFKREGAYVPLRLIHAVVWQKPTQHCKAVILQLQIKH